MQSFNLDTFLKEHCKELRTLHLTDIDPTHLSPDLVNRVDSMKDIRLPEDVPAREIEGQGENTRAWEILERDEEADKEFWARFFEEHALRN